MLYFLLVFVAMSIVGLFLVREFRQYNINNVRMDMENISNNLISNNRILKEGNFLEKKAQLQEELSKIPISGGYEISIIEPVNFEIIASTNQRFIKENSLKVLDENTILTSLSRDMVEKDIKSNTKDGYTIKNASYPQRQGDGQIKYIIYIRASLDLVENMMSSVVSMLIRSTIIALGITVVLGYFIATTITKPINQISSKVNTMSEGDFSQRVEVYSSDEIGQLAVAFNILSDRVERSLEELDGERNKLNAIIYHMQDGLVATDTHGVIIHYNPNFLLLLGLDDNIMGKKYNEVIGNFKSAISIELMADIAKDSNGKSIILHDHQNFIRATSAIFKDEKGTLAGLIVTLCDITKTQRLEEMRKEFVANVSHELKTPITSIKSYSQTLLEGGVDDRVTLKKFLAVIDSEADRMTQIIKDLLQLSHIDYGNAKWNMAVHDISEVVDEAIKTLKPFADEKKIQIDYEAEQRPLKITIDKSKILQCILNLVSNAIKYSPESSSINLSTRVVDKWCEICVKDKGIGIPKSDIGSIFERFYRVDKGRARSQGGTGLGLSIVKAIIDEHKGEIYVKSDLGEGSIFLVRLPVDNIENLVEKIEEL